MTGLSDFYISMLRCKCWNNVIYVASFSSIKVSDMNTLVDSTCKSFYSLKNQAKCSLFSTLMEASVNSKDWWDLTLARLPRDNLELDPLAVIHLDKRLYIFLCVSAREREKEREREHILTNQAIKNKFIFFNFLMCHVFFKSSKVFAHGNQTR